MPSHKWLWGLRVEAVSSLWHPAKHTHGYTVLQLKAAINGRDCRCGIQLVEDIICGWYFSNPNTKADKDSDL